MIISTKIDIWSSGIILYELLVGDKPFFSEGSLRQFLEKISQGLQISHYFALTAAGCSEAAWRLLSQILTRVEFRLRLEDIRSHDWLSPVSSSTLMLEMLELDLNQELEVAKEVIMCSKYFSSDVLTLSYRPS